MRRHWTLAAVVVAGVVAFSLLRGEPYARGTLHLPTDLRQLSSPAPPPPDATLSLPAPSVITAPAVTPAPMQLAIAEAPVVEALAQARDFVAPEPPPAPPAPRVAMADMQLQQTQVQSEPKKGPDGHPKLIGADHPGEAAQFRRLSLISEDGEIAENGLMNAARHVQEMRGAQPPPGADSGAGITRGSWTWMGPGNIGGRVRSLLIHPSSPSTMFVGGVDGGIWKTTNGGSSWSPIDDFMANLAVSTLAMSPTNSSVMFAGTGEGFYNGDGIRGAGIFKSTDGGTTWAQLPGTANSSFHYVNRIAISPNGNTLLAATRGGIQRSIDGGASWTPVPSVFEPVDVNFHPTDSTKAVVAGYDGEAAYSINGGASFTLAAGLPGGFSRVEIAYAPSNPATVYASVDVSGGSLYVSNDGGATFGLRFNGFPDYLSGQGWYDNALWVNPNDANFIIAGGVDLYKSLDGGFTFVKISNWAASPSSAHADHHVIVSHPGFNNTTNKTVYFGNDGGIYRADDVSSVGGGGAANCVGACSSGWTSLNNNLGVTQFYGGAGQALSGVIIGGTQDNGSLKYTVSGGVNGWVTTFGGDGGYAAIDQTNNANLYGEYVYLTLHRSMNGGSSSDWINGLYWNGSSYVCKPAPYRIGDAGVDGCSPTSYGTGANFIAPFIMDPNNQTRLLAGGLRLWRTNDATTPNTAATGPSWASIKPSIGSNISAIAVAKLNSDVVWVGHNNGNVYSTTNGTAATPVWTQRDTNSPGLPNRMVTRITVDPSDSNIVYVTFGGFNADNLWRSMDGGLTWAQVSGAGVTALPSAPIRDLEVHPTNSNWLYAATEVGVFASENAGISWMLPHDGPANVSVDELFFMGSDLVAVTHGRGIFKQPVGTSSAPAPVTGRVTNASTGAPIQNIGVLFYNAANNQVGQTFSNALGNYSVNLAPGTYYARTSNSLGYINKVFDNIVCATTCNATLGTPIVVTAAGAGNINFDLNPGARISGSVIDANGGAPLANISVWVYTTAGETLLSGLTDATGTYQTSSGLAPGTYYLYTSNSLGYVNEAYDNVVCSYCDPRWAGTPITIVDANPVTGINFDLALGGRIGGRVTDDAGVPNPLSGVSVQVHALDGSYAGAATTDASGNYVLSGLLPGDYFARTYNSSGRLNRLYDNIACVSSACDVTSGTPIPVSANVTTGNINFSLPIGGRASGVVSNVANGQVLSGITVHFYDSGYNYLTYATTDASGNYISRDGLPAGNVFAVTDNSIGFINEVFNNVECVGCNAVASGTPISITIGETRSGINFQLALGGRFSGSLTSATTGQPIPEGYLQVFSATAQHVTWVYPNSAGQYVTPGLPPGNYYVKTYNTSGFRDELYNNFNCFPFCTITSGTPITVSVGGIVTGINIALQPGGRISGTVTNAATFAPVAGVQVDIYNTAGAYQTSGYTNELGQFITGGGLPAGNYRARTYNYDGLINEAYNNITCVGCNLTVGDLIAVVEGATTSGVDFALAPGGRIGGRLTNEATGQPIVGGSAWVYDSVGNYVFAASSNSSGHYVTPGGLPNGNYFVRTSVTGFANELYNNIPCSNCLATIGTPVPVNGSATTLGIDFALAPAGAISGTITNALNGAPLSGIEVDVYTATGSFVAYTSTNGAGFYTLPNLPPGSYRLRTFNGQSFINEVYNDIPCVASCSVTTGTAVNVSAGVTTGNINFALTAGGRISGRVTNAASGAGISGVRVSIYDNSVSSITTVTADASGNYTTTTGLVAGSYYVLTGGTAGFIDELYNDMVCAPWCTVTAGTPVAVALGATTTNINFALNPGGQISGSMTNAATGQPLSSQSVVISNASGFGRFISTNSSGQYVSPGLPPGTYYLRTSNSLGYVDERFDNQLCIGGTCSATQGTGVPVVGTSTTAGINFALDLGGRINGRVTDAGTGSALSSVSIDIRNALNSTLVTVSSDVSGNYTTPGLPAGTYYARSRNSLGQRYVDEAFNDVPCAGCNVAQVGTPMNVTPGITTTGVDFALANTGGSIAGFVTTPAGAPIGGVSVDIYSATGSFVTSATSTNATGSYVTPTGLPAGTYYARTSNSLGYVNELFDNLDCFLSCSATDGQPIVVAGGVTTNNINFTLGTGGRISGRVTNASGVGLSGIIVTFYTPSGSSAISVGTDSQGNYTTSTAFPPGTYFARTSNSVGYVDEAFNNVPCLNCTPTQGGTPIVVSAGVITPNINFVLDVGGRISGRITDASTSQGLSGVSAQIYSPTRSLITSATTDASGNYTIATGLPMGSYYVRSFNSLRYIDEVFNNQACVGCDITIGTPVNVSPGIVTSGIDLALTPGGGAISGTVTNSATSLPASGVTISVYNASGSFVTSVTSDGTGNYSTGTGLLAGNYFARSSNSIGLINEVFDNITCLGCTPANGSPIAVAPGATTSGIDFALAPGAQVSGIVTSSANGAPMAGVSMTLYTSSGVGFTSATSRANGSYFVTTGAPTGTYYARTTNAGAFNYEDQLFENIPCLAGCTPVNGTPINLVAANVTPNINFSLLTATPRLTVSAATVAAASPVTVTLRNGLGGATDWMALAQVGAVDTSYLQYTYVGAGVVNRAWTFNAPNTPGQYEVRLFQNDGYVRLATSPIITVVPGLSVSDVSLDEGQSGTTNALFNVTLSAPSPQAVSVSFATSNGTATSGSDYVATSGTLNFSPGQVSLSIPVTINGDATFEPNETFTLTLSNPVNAILSDAVGIGTIRADDGGPTLAIDDVAVVEGDSGTVTALFTVTLSPAAPGNVTVDFVSVDGTAAAGSDYIAVNGTLAFAPGEQSKTIAVTVNGDSTAEPNENFFIDLANATVNALIGDSRGVGTIVNDEGPRIAVNATTAASGSPVTATLTNAPGGATDWMTLARVGAAEQTYLAWTYVGAGLTTRNWTVPMPPVPGPYEFRFYLNNSFTRTATSPAVTVLPGMTINDVAIAEGNAGSQNLVFTVSLSAPNPNPVSVQYSTGGGTAAAGNDYTATSGTLSFAANQLSMQIAVPVSGDGTFEPTETFVMTLANAVNAILTDAQGTGTITNDDLGPTLTIGDVSVVEGDSGTVNAVFTVSLNPVAANVTVDYATANLSAVAPGDYTAASGTLVFPGNVSSQTITVVVNGDLLAEPNETFAVNLSNVSANAAIGDAQGVGTIVNDEGPRLTPSVTAAAANAPVTLSLNNTPGGPTDWVVLAPVGAPDLTYLNWTYVGAGVTSRTWTINMPAIPGAYEFRLFANNTFNRLATSAPVNVLPGISINNVSLAEGNAGSANAVFTISLSAPSTQVITVQYATADGSATAGSDYTATSGTATFAAGVTTQTVSVPVSGDVTFEPNETFTVTLSNVANALITTADGQGTIVNDDTGPTLSINDASLAEGDSGSAVMTFTVTLSPAAADVVTVNYATANQTATSGSDYTAATGTLTFNAGETSKTFTVAILGDLAGEPNETFRVDLSNASVNAAIGDGLGIGTILNDDGPRIVPSVTSIVPGGEVTFSLNNSPGGPADWLALAPAGAPNTVYSTYVYVGAGVTSRTWTVTMPMVPVGPWEARLFENNTFNRLATSATVTTMTGLSINDVSIEEGDSGNRTASFVVALSGPSSLPVTVQYATADGTAQAGSDFVAVNGTLTFNPGVLQQLIQVPIITEPTFEPNETFSVVLSNPSNALLTDATGVGTIRNDDLGPTLTINDVALAEGDSGSSLMTFTVGLSPAAAGAVTVDYATANQTATAGSDYTAASGTLTFNAGETSKTFTVSILGDTGGEPNETFRVDLTNASVNAAIGDGVGIGTIVNDDGPRIVPSISSVAPGAQVTFTLNNSPGGPTDWLALAPVGSGDTTYSTFTYVGAGVTSRPWTVTMPLAPLGQWEARLFANNTYTRLATSTPVTVAPGLSVNDVNLTEGNTGTANATFTVTLSGPSSQVITVQYATADGTATAGSDYTAASGTLTFNPGVVTQTFAVSVAGDVTFEPSEIYAVTLSNPTNALITDGTGTGTIVNDDAGPTLTINDVALAEGDSGSSLMTFTVSLTPAAAGAVTVDYATANQTATAGSDYTAASGTLTFNAGETSKTFTVSILGDTAGEPSETFRVDLTNASVNSAIGDGVGIGTIVNDDGPRIVPSISSVAPGGQVTFTLNNSPGGPTDWLALAPVGSGDTTYSTFTYVGAGVTSRPWTVTMPMAPLGQWEARLFANNTYTRLATSTPVTVAPGLSVNDVSLTEGNAGTANATFTVTLSGPSSQVITVQYATADGTATAGSDYTAASGTLTFNPGVLTQTFAVPVAGDVTFEPSETYTVTLSNPTNALITDGSGTGTIVNDDAGPTLTINDVALPEGDSGSSLMTFTVSLSPAAAGAVTVDYATANQTATAGSDYTAASGTLTFNAGETSKTFTVSILGDTGGEPSETFRVDLTNASVNSAIGDGVGIGTIVNDDGPRIVPSITSVAPGGQVTFTLNNSPGGPTDWLALAPSGAPDTSYVTYVYVGAGVTSRAWTVTMPMAPLGNWEARLFENNTFSRIATSTPVTVAPGLAVNDVTMTEGNAGTANAIFTVTLSGSSPQAITVQYATANGTATAGSDYTAASGTLTFNPGVVSQTFTVPITGDVTFEPNETFTVTLSNPTNALITDGTGSATIVNDDAGPTLTINDVALAEGDSGSSLMTFTVALSPAAAGAVTVDYATANQTATAGSDYTAASGTLTFNAGETSKTFTVSILGDTGGEPNETFRVELANASVNAAIGDGVGIGTIVNDDGPRIVPSVAAVAPGGQVTFTLNNSPGGPNDWLALAPSGAPDTSYATYVYVGAGVTSRAWTVTMPMAPLGNWEARLFANNTYTRLATSTPVALAPGLAVNDVTIAEGNSGSANALFTVTLSASSPQAITVQYATADGTATAASDYAAASGTLTFNPGVVSQTFTVPISGDVTFEPNETFTVTLSNPTNALLMDAGGVGTILNDDTGPTLSINDVALSEGDSGSSVMTFTVGLSPAAAGAVTVDYATANQTATAGSDYTATSGTLTFNAGETSKTFTVAVLGDAASEPNETFQVDLSNASANAAIGDGRGIGTIVNDDGPRFTVAATTAAAGALITAQLANAPGGATDWIALAPVSAPNESYAAYTYVGAGVTSRNWSVPAPSVVGPYEFRLFLNNGYSRAATSVAINVVPSVGLQANVDIAEGNSGTSNAVFNVTLSAASAAVVTVNYATADGTATAGSDYTAATGTVTFPAGVTTRTINVPIIGDTSVEPGETFTLTLSNASNAIIGTATRIGTIVNDDSAGPCADADGDRLCNAVETNTGVFVSAANTGTNPNVADTDGDALPDGDEVLGTLGGLNLPAMGTNPLRKNILFEYDWVDDSYFEPSVDGASCGAHSHRPTQTMIDRVSLAFAAAPLSNPDGSTGITLIHDFGQGGAFTGGTALVHAPNLTGGVNGADFVNTKSANFAANRHGYFHYVFMPHWYTDGLGSSGQAELPGDDLIVTLGCFISTNNVANTIMHEAGHNFNIRHGGNENCNWKPNYNSVMNYRFQFPGVDTSCNAVGNSGEINVLDFSRGTRIALNENALNENSGTCGATPIDWNFSGTFTSGLVYDLNRSSSNPTAATSIENFGCTAALQTLNDHNDWANLSFTGLADADGNSLLGLWMYYAKEIVTETNAIPGLRPPQ